LKVTWDEIPCLEKIWIMNSFTNLCEVINIIFTIWRVNWWLPGLYYSVISQTLKYIWNMSDFNTTSNPHRYLTLFVPKTPSVVWYFIINLIPSNFHSYLALFESKSIVIVIYFHCLIIFFKLYKITQTLHGVFSFPIWTSI